MLNKHNITEIIEKHDKEISEIKSELTKADSETVRSCLKQRLSFLEDNRYRYKLQAKAWGLPI